MSEPNSIRVRVLPERGLSIDGAHHVAGDELELAVDDAKQLIADGFVEKLK